MRFFYDCCFLINKHAAVQMFKILRKLIRFIPLSTVHCVRVRVLSTPSASLGSGLAAARRVRYPPDCLLDAEQLINSLREVHCKFIKNFSF